MRQSLGALLLVALAAHSVHAACTGKTSGESYVGDVSLVDNAVQFGASGFVRLPEIELGSSYHAFEMDVFTSSGDGCLFSFGTAGTNNYVEARIQGRAIKFLVGTSTEATSLAVVDQNIWQHISFHLNNKAENGLSTGKVEIFVDNLRVVPDAQASGAIDRVNVMSLGKRSGFLGKCATGGPITAIDNFFITDSKRTVDDIEATLRQFFPILKENGLVAYFDFNEEGTAAAKSAVGQSTQNYIQGTLGSTATRVARVSLDRQGILNTDKVCTHNGATVVLSGESNQAAPYFGINGGGYSNTLDCTPDDTPSWAVNQRWDNNGAVIGLTIFSHVQHRWRITPGANLIVERADWGGWLQIAESVGVIQEDGSTYIVGKDEFQLQVASIGWIRVTLASPTSLSYQYAINSKSCATAAVRDVCTWKTIDRDRYLFNYIPMSEPMGLAPTTAGVGNLPATLACPTPTFGGYPYGGNTGAFCDQYQPNGEMRCCNIPGKYYAWCPPKYEECWGKTAPWGVIRSPARDHAWDQRYCCANFKYEFGSVSNRRLDWCPVTLDDCHNGPFSKDCCTEALRIDRSVSPPRTLAQCDVTQYDCWEVGVADTRCCTWNWASGTGLRYRGGKRHKSCPLVYEDCHLQPGAAFQDTECCSDNTGRHYDGRTTSLALKYNAQTFMRLEYCPPNKQDCWKWFVDNRYPMQQDLKCCVREADVEKDKRFWINAAGERIALPYCEITNADCWAAGVIDARCCSSDDRKYFLNPDGSLDYTRRLYQCTPTVDDCWGWDTNPTKFPRKVEDQRCCDVRATRYHPVTGRRLDYCFPNFDDCWGYHLAGAMRDDDSRCCERYPEAKNERLPYCPPSQPVPPPPPVSPPPPPALPIDVCAKMKASDLTKYNSIVSTCESLWGPASVTNTARLTCIATMCKNEDPNTPVVPDCRVERLLKASNPNHVLPPACVSQCPNACYGRGSCNTNTRACTCQSGWTGADCSIPTNYNKCEFSVMASAFAQCQPFPITYQNAGTTQMLTRDFSNITVQYYDMAKRIRDTTTIYMAKTISDFNTRAERFHLFITNNDGTGTVGGSYTMTLTFGAGSDLSQTRWANLGTGVSLSISANVVTVTAAWTKTQTNGIVLFNLTASAAPTFTIRMDKMAPQVVMGCRSPTGAFEVNRLTTEQTTVAGVSVRCATLNTNCFATDCKSCAALPNCGWCVETGSCQPGDAAGPFASQCFNWRFTFDSNINRRLTIIPGFPTNPRLTDVFLRQAPGGNELPIEIGIDSFDSQSVPWDLVMMNEFTSKTMPALHPQGITRILTALTEFPNAGIALANLRTDASGYNFIKLITNPRDFGGIPTSLANLDSGVTTPETGDLDVLAAIVRAADPINEFNLRPAARSIFLITATRGFVNRLSDATYMQTVRQALLNRNAALVCAVPARLVPVYQELVRVVGFGRVITVADDLSNIAAAVPTAIVRAATSIGLNVGTQTGHIAMTSFDSRRETYTIDNIRPPMRAKFWVPVNRVASGSRFTELYFPSYGRSTVETVPTDAPEGLTEKSFTFKSNVASLIELKGKSFRNLFPVVFNITRIPNSLKGNLFIAAMNPTTGAWEKASPADLPASGELLQSSLPYTVPFGRVLYQPKNPNAEGENFDMFSYRVIDGCTESVEYNVSISVFAADRPPVAEMPGPRGREGEPLLVSLGAYNPDGATIVFKLTRNLYDATEGANRTTFPIGKFCAYNPQTFGTPAFDRNCAPVTAENNAFTGNELVYVPPFYGHSFADPTKRPELLIIPCFSYKVDYVFSSTGKAGSSAELDVQIVLDHVNQAPFAWGDSQDTVKDAVFKFDWNTIEGPLRAKNPVNSDMVCVPKVGGATCTYEEDFGERYWWNTGYRFISVGGYDLEASNLTLEITQLNLPEGATLLAWYDDSRNVRVGDIIPNLASGSLNHVLRFRPEKEQHSRPTNTSVYASFSYRVRDNEGAVSVREARVDIVVLPVDKPPRMSRQMLDVTVYEGRPKDFPIDAEDPEGQPFKSFLVGCTSKKGALYVCKDASQRCDPVVNPNNVVRLDCNNIPANGLEVPATRNAAGGVEFVGIYSAPKLASVSEGLKYETVFFEFRDDSVARFTPYKFVVNFNVIKINQAPEILVADESGAETSDARYTSPLPMGTAWSPKIRIQDSDIGFGIMDMNITIDDAFAGSMKFDLAALGNGGALQGVRVQRDKIIAFRGSLAAANKLLSRLSANINIIPDSGVATGKVFISVSDNGYTGQCPDSQSFSVRTCAQTDAAEFTINWAKTGDNNSVTVAASASAAAFAGVAAVAAALLFRKLNSKAENGYTPWDVNDLDDAVVANPLYESNGTEGVNPLFENPEDNAKL